MIVSHVTPKGSPNYEMTVVKKGRRTYGAYYVFDNGVKIYMAWRKFSDIFCSGKKDISEALRNGCALWAIDEDDLITIRAKGCSAAGVLVKDTGDKYIAPIDVWTQHAKFLNYTKRGGSKQKYLNIDLMLFHPGKLYL
jgi:hypothetical protein